MNSLNTPVTLAAAVVTVLAVLFYFWTGINVARARGKHGVKAPTMTGPLPFECAVRVQANTLEWMVIFLPFLWLATLYFSPAMTIAWLAWLPPAIGIIWVIGRWVYMTGYMAAPEKRETGFLIAALAITALLICSIVGIVMAWNAGSAA